MDLGKMFSLSGRIGRKDYIILWLVVIAIGFAASALSGFDNPSDLVVAVESLIAAVIMVPAGFKRLHDTGKSGWWMLIGLVPFVGQIAFLILTWVFRGDSGANQYGLPNSGSPFPSLHNG